MDIGHPIRFRSPDLGPSRALELPQGTICYHERGAGPAVVLAHGWLANANLWRKVVPLLAGEHRCIVLDLPLGAHLVPMAPGFTGTPEAVGALINSAVDALELQGPVLVGNDSGGAYAQIAAAARPDRVRGLVLNACETPYDPFPPVTFSGLQRAAASTAALSGLLGALRDRAVRRSPAAFGRLVKHPMDDAVSDSYALPALEIEGVLRDAGRVMSSASQSYVAAAAERLIATFRGLVTFAWPLEDQVFSLDNVRRYAKELRRARVELVADSFAFTPEDQPERLATLVAATVAAA